MNQLKVGQQAKTQEEKKTDEGSKFRPEMKLDVLNIVNTATTGMADALAGAAAANEKSPATNRSHASCLSPQSGPKKDGTKKGQDRRKSQSKKGLSALSNAA